MKNEILFHYNLYNDWKAPSIEAIEKTQNIGLIFALFYALLFVSKILIDNHFLKELNSLEYISYVTIFLMGSFQYSFPRAYLNPVKKFTQKNFIEVSTHEIKWRKGFFSKVHTVRLSEIKSYSFQDLLIRLQTINKKVTLDTSFIKNTDKRKELNQLLHELSKRNN